MRHELKIQQPFADAVVEGRKTFELRYNDRGFQVGDTIQFTAINGSYYTDSMHPINGREYEITYVLGGWGLNENWVALAIRELLRGDAE